MALVGLSSSSPMNDKRIDADAPLDTNYYAAPWGLGPRSVEARANADEVLREVVR